jgi:hypothetical protein
MNFLVINSRTANLLLGISYFIKIELTFLYKPNRAVRAKLRSSNYKRTIIVTITRDPILVEGNKSEN